MNITSELREWAKALTHWWYDPVKDQYTYTTDTMPSSIDAIRLDSSILAIADRIDAEHQKALDEWKAEHGQMWLKGYSECHAELLEGNETLASDLERCGWIRLPLDADNVPVSIGDRMEWVRYKDDDPTIVRKVSAVGADVFFAWSDEQGRYAQYEAHAYRHHHAPTVEDVLREFADLVRKEHVELATISDDAITEYASKLQLREDA